FGGHFVDGKRARSSRAYTAGRRLFTANSTRRLRSVQNAPPSKSVSVLPATSARCNLSRRVCFSRAPGCQRTALRLTPATARVSSGVLPISTAHRGDVRCGGRTHGRAPTQSRRATGGHDGAPAGDGPTGWGGGHGASGG